MLERLSSLCFDWCRCIDDAFPKILHIGPLPRRLRLLLKVCLCSQGEQTDALCVVTLGENKVNFYWFIGARGDVRNTSAAASAGVRGVRPTLTAAGWERHGAHSAACLPS